MEDWNMLGADCVVISCCCQCLMLQILVFVLLKLPRKLIRKTTEYAKKKLRQRKGNDHRGIQREMGSYKDVLERIHDQSIRIQADMALIDDVGHDCGACMDQVEKVMEEFYQKGEFAFGSFWGRKDPMAVPTIVNDHDDVNFVRYQIIDLVGSLSYA